VPLKYALVKPFDGRLSAVFYTDCPFTFWCSLEFFGGGILFWYFKGESIMQAVDF
jgi:hypothetical protein